MAFSAGALYPCSVTFANQDWQKMGIALNNVRFGKKYRLVNNREVFEFEIMEAFHGDEFLLKDIHTLEQYYMGDLLKFGRGKDFSIVEI